MHADGRWGIAEGGVGGHVDSKLDRHLGEMNDFALIHLDRLHRGHLLAIDERTVRRFEVEQGHMAVKEEAHQRMLPAGVPHHHHVRDAIVTPEQHWNLTEGDHSNLGLSLV